MTQISGPIPSADELAKYEAVLPGAAERLLSIHEEQVARLGKQADHRMELEKTVVFGDSWRAWAGLAVGELSFSPLDGWAILSPFRGMTGSRE